MTNKSRKGGTDNPVFPVIHKRPQQQDATADACTVISANKKKYRVLSNLFQASIFSM